MGVATWLNIPIANGQGAVIYRVWDAIYRLLPLHPTMAGTWTVVSTSGGAVPTWSGDASIASGDWIVIQCESPWATGEKLQVFLGWRGTSGTLAGFGTKAAGLWCAFSTSGGWNAGGYFGSSLADWRNGSISTIAGYATASLLMLILTSGATNRAGSAYIGVRQGTSEYLVFGAVAAVPPVGFAESRCRTVLLRNMPSSTSFGWQTNTAYGLATNTAASGYDVAYVTPLGDYGLDRDTSQRVETDSFAIHDAATNTRLGLLDSVYRCSAADGDTNGPAVTATRWVWFGYSWPRDPARDGIWV